MQLLLNFKSAPKASLSGRFIFTWADRLSTGVVVLKEEHGLIALHKPHGKMCHPNPSVSNPSARIRTKTEECIFHNAFYDVDQEIFLPAKIEGKARTGTLSRAPEISAKPEQGVNNGMEVVKDPAKHSFIWLLHRLDSATSGVLLVASNKQLAAAVKRKFKRREDVIKTYVAVVFERSPDNRKTRQDSATGLPVNKTAVWEDYISIDKSGAVIRAQDANKRVIDKSQGISSRNIDQRYTKPVSALTEVTTLIEPTIIGVPGMRIALLALRPLTGYTHQLRYQCAVRGFPIVGDKSYGDFESNKWFRSQLSFTNRETGNSDSNICHSRDSGAVDLAGIFGKEYPSDRLFLHAKSLELTYDIDNTLHHFNAESPLPDYFTKLFEFGTK